jgi:hypothetical protein
MSLLTVNLPDPTGYGRIIRDPSGRVLRIVEQKDASPAELAVREGNTGVMAVPANLLREWLGRLRNANAQGEYYLTDIVEMAVAAQVAVVPLVAPTIPEVLGINDRLQLAEVEAEYRRLRDNYALQVDGDPSTNPSESPYNMIDQVSMKQYRDQWRRYTELSGLFLGLGYFFSIGEAFVDAHLGTFDVGDDLSFSPRVVPSAGGIPALGIGMRYSLNRTRPQTVVSPYQPAVLYRASHP